MMGFRVEDPVVALEEDPSTKADAMRVKQIQVNERESEPWPKVAIVLLNWNGWQETIGCLESLRGLNYPDYHVLVVDNGSTDGSSRELRAWVERNRPAEVRAGEPAPQSTAPDSRFVVLENAENLGFSEGVNVGIKHVLTASPSTRFVFLLNNDARLEPSAITHCVRASLDEGAAIVGAVVHSLDGGEVLFAGARFPQELFAGGRVALVTSVPGRAGVWKSPRAEASAMLIRRDLIEARFRECEYLLNPALFMYLEEMDLCRWAHERGLSTVMAGEAIAYHGLGRSGGALRHYYLTRNRILLARRMLSFPQRVAFLAWFFPFRLVQALMKFLEGKSAAANAIVSGLRDGIRSVTGRWVQHPLSREELE